MAGVWPLGLGHLGAAKAFGATCVFGKAPWVLEHGLPRTSANKLVLGAMEACDLPLLPV